MHRKLTIVALAAALLAGACGNDEPAPGAAETGEPTASTEATADTGDDATTSSVTDPSTDDADVPEAIISLSPTATEMLFAIDAGDQVVAVDDESDFPAGVPTTDLSGFEPNVEAIAAFEPDLVVLQGGYDDAVAGLEALDIEVLVQPAATTLDDTYDQIAELGIVTGHEDEAAALVADMRAEIDALSAAIPRRTEPLTYYHELDPLLYSVTDRTFIGQLYTLAQLTSIANVADPDGALGGYPQVSAELIVDADPDVVFLADSECCGETAETFAARPGFADLSAVRNGAVVNLSDDVASRWGPRVVEMLRTIIEATASVPVG